MLSAVPRLAMHGMSDTDMRLGILTSLPERAMGGMEDGGRTSMSMASGLFKATRAVMMWRWCSRLWRGWCWPSAEGPTP